MDNDVLKLIKDYTEAISQINSANIEINKKKDRNFLIAFIVSISIIGFLLFYSIFQTYNYTGYPQTEITNTATATNNNNK